MAIRYGKGLIGAVVVVALLALLVHWIGINTIELYRDDLLFYLQAHLILVLVSMLAALIVGIPAGILLSRPNMVGRAERFMQIFNIGNTVPTPGRTCHRPRRPRHRQRPGHLRAVSCLPPTHRAQHYYEGLTFRAP